MRQEGIVDLDELIVKCRNQSAKKYIAEAVACYRSGAYRASIVATWIALTFDFIGKLNELNLAGDKQAEAICKELEDIRAKNDISASLRFEREILAKAKNQFQLLSPIECQDLERLLEDRNRCAHPSMVSMEEPFNPTAELARYHLRNTVLYFLQRPPVQGKAALERIQKEISSEYFPKDYELAVLHFQSGPLSRAKDSLVRNLVIILTKKLLLDNDSYSLKCRQISALKAIRKMYPADFENAINNNFSRIISSIEDDGWDKVIRYIYAIPITWDLVGADNQIKAIEYIKSTELPTIIAKAIQIEPLKTEAIVRMNSVSEQIFKSIVQIFQTKEATDCAVKYFVSSGSFDGARNNFREMILPLSQFFNSEQVKQIIIAYKENRQIKDSFGIEDLYADFFKLTKIISKELKEDWKGIFEYCHEFESGEYLGSVLAEEFPEFKVEEKKAE